MKKWKKTHRQKRKKRQVIINIDLDMELLQKLDSYRKKYNLSRQYAFRKILKKAMANSKGDI